MLRSLFSFFGSLFARFSKPKDRQEFSDEEGLTLINDSDDDDESDEGLELSLDASPPIVCHAVASVQVPEFFLPETEQEWLGEIAGLVEGVKKRQAKYDASLAEIENLLRGLDNLKDSARRELEKRGLQAERQQLGPRPEVTESDEEEVTQRLRHREREKIVFEGSVLLETPLEGRGRVYYSAFRRLIVFEGKWYLCSVEEPRGEASYVAWISTAYEQLTQEELEALNGAGF